MPWHRLADYGKSVYLLPLVDFMWAEFPVIPKLYSSYSYDLLERLVGRRNSIISDECNEVDFILMEHIFFNWLYLLLYLEKTSTCRGQSYVCIFSLFEEFGGFE